MKARRMLHRLFDFGYLIVGVVIFLVVLTNGTLW